MSEADPHRPGKDITILVADDDQDILGFVSLCLEREGYTVLASRDGEEALEAARRHRPALAILDVMMPRRSGPDLVRELRADPATEEIPVILITARVGEADIEEAMSSGAQECLKKPFTPRELTARVEELLSA